MRELATCAALPLAGAVKNIRLIPSGLFRATDGRPAGVAGWILTANNAKVIIQAAASRANDFVLDYEHQTMQASKNGQPAPAAGWFKRLEWRDGEGGGLFALDVRWTARAAAMIAAREYRYISPVFGFDAKTGEVQNIHSAAITNDPALDGLTDIAAAKRQANSDTAHSGMLSHRCPGTVQQKEHDNWVMRHTFGKNAPQIK